jgi:hypothetical protein
VRTAVRQRGSLTFDSGRTIEPPLLLAIPLAALTIASLVSGGFGAVRILGVSVLSAITAFCITRGLKRIRVEVRLQTQELIFQRHFLKLTAGARLIVSQAEPTALGGKYELTLFDGPETRRVLLRSSLSQILNEIRRVRPLWSIPAESQLETRPPLDSALLEDTDMRATSLPSSADMSFPTLNHQFQLASILGAVACIACGVVLVLVRKQLQTGEPITALSWFLGAMLVLVPAVIALHTWMGNVRVSISAKSVRIEHRRGLLGVRRVSIPQSDLLGLWAVASHQAQHGELLLLSRDGFFSVPVANICLDNWKLRLNLSG